MKDNLPGATLIIMIALSCICLGALVGADIMENAAIEHNAAIYHPKTGEFTWMDELDETDTSPD